MDLLNKPAWLLLCAARLFTLSGIAGRLDMVQTKSGPRSCRLGPSEPSENDDHFFFLASMHFFSFML